MAKTKEKYINPFTDFGFKRLFGEEPSKDLLLDFLNELLREREGRIKEISYLPNENLPINIGDRKAIFDIYCVNEKGEKFIVEMQKAEQQYFKDRMVFYASFPIQAQGKGKGKEWNFKLKHVYAIGILDFAFKEDDADPAKYRYDSQLMDIETKEVFYDKLTFTYLSMTKFNKSIDELETKFDKWLYVLKNLNRLKRIPPKLQEKIFLKFFHTAEIAKMKPKEYKEYEKSVNAYRDIKNSIDWAEKKGEIRGEKRGEIKGIRKVALKALRKGLAIEDIVDLTDLSIEEIAQLKQNNDKND